MADMMIHGRVAHAKVREYDFVADDGRRVFRSGLDVQVAGSQLDGVCTTVRVDHPADVQTLQEAGQFSLVNLTCTGPTKSGLFDLIPGSVQVLEGNPKKG